MITKTNAYYKITTMKLDQNKNRSLVSCKYVVKEYKTQDVYKLILP